MKGLDPDIVHVNALIFPIHVGRLRRVLSDGAALIVRTTVAPGRNTVRAGGFSVGASRKRTRSCSRLLPRPTSGEPPVSFETDRGVYEVFESSSSFRPPSSESAKPGSRFLYLGRLIEDKDPLTVLRAFSRVTGRLREAHLRMIFPENGGLLPAIQNTIRELALETRVELVGAVSHDLVERELGENRLSHLGKSPRGKRLRGPQGTSMWCVSLSDIPSFRRIADDERCGSLWRLGDDAALAEALLEAQRRHPGRAALRESFERRCSFDAIAREAMTAYQKAWSRRGGGKDRR